VVVLALLVGLASVARAGEDRFPIEDAIDVQLIGRELVAVINLGGPLRTRLEQGEQVVFSGARGRVGVVVTNRRVLGVSPGATGWLEAPRRVQERPSGDPLMGSRVALVLSDQRVLAYDGDAGRWVEESVGPNEAVREVTIAQAVAVVATGRRGLALASGTGRFAEVSLHVGERFESLTSLADVATLRTDRRVLVFRGDSGSWGSESLPLY